MNTVEVCDPTTSRLKPGLHEPQLQGERSVTLVSSIVVERRC